LIEDVDYFVQMMIPMGKNYFGIVKIDFNLKNIPSDDKPLFLDYYGNFIGQYEINGQIYNSELAFRNGTIILPS
jgi:hypothetical protein